MANRLGETGPREVALERAQETLALYRQLAQQRPDAFLPDVATSLHNLANRLKDVGRRQEALEHTQEAVRIRRQLAQQWPDAFLPDLGRSLNNVANRLGEVGKREEALEHAREAMGIYRELAQRNPEAFLPELARTLGVAANLLLKAHPDDALRYVEEGLRILAPFFSRLPDAHAPLMRWIRSIYLRATEAVGVAADRELLHKSSG
jgi:tetratricopeptide (TPR) repeat protein